MQGWELAVVVLVAVAVGAALPALIQLALTLKTARTVLTSSSRRLDEALEQASAATANIGQLAESLNELAEKLRAVATVGAAVGPAVAAAVRAFHASSAAVPNGRENGHVRTGREDGHSA